MASLPCLGAWQRPGDDPRKGLGGFDGKGMAKNPSSGSEGGSAKDTSIDVELPLGTNPSRLLSVAQFGA